MDKVYIIQKEDTIDGFNLVGGAFLDFKLAKEALEKESKKAKSEFLDFCLANNLGVNDILEETYCCNEDVAYYHIQNTKGKSYLIHLSIDSYPICTNPNMVCFEL